MKRGANMEKTMDSQATSLDKANKKQNIYDITIKQDEETEKNWLYVRLQQGNKFITDGEVVYDVREYGVLKEVFSLHGELCASFQKADDFKVIALKTKEVLFQDNKAYAVYKLDDKTLEVHRTSSKPTVYNLEAKKYLTVPDAYCFAYRLENGLYVFQENLTQKTNSVYRLKNMVLNQEGEAILSEVQGFISCHASKLTIREEDAFHLVTLENEKVVQTNTFQKNDTLLALPEIWQEDKLILVEKNRIGIWNTNMELLHEIKVNLTEVLDMECMEDLLKLYIPYEVENKKVGRHLFIDLKQAKMLSHVRIDSYPHFHPRIYMGFDFLKQRKKYFFYNENFEQIKTASIDHCTLLDDAKHCLFFFETSLEKDTIKKELFNADTGAFKEVDYDSVFFFDACGYGVHEEMGTIDLLDENFHVLFPSFAYKKYNFKLSRTDFCFQVVNGYLCLWGDFVDDFGNSSTRIIILDKEGKTLVNSCGHTYKILGDVIQVSENDTLTSQFLNTRTGNFKAVEIPYQSGEENLITTTAMQKITELLDSKSSESSIGKTLQKRKKE